MELALLLFLIVAVLIGVGPAWAEQVGRFTLHSIRSLFDRLRLGRERRVIEE